VSTGAVIGGTTDAGSAAVVTTGVALGPVALGAECSPDVQYKYTWDCWKPVLHDISTEPSTGILLKDVVLDPRIKMCIW